MKKLVVTAIALAASTSAFASEYTVRVEEVATPDSVIAQIEEMRDRQSGCGDFRDGDDLDTNWIVNTAKAAWAVIKENQPILNVKADYANALPRAATYWDDVANFSDLQYKTHRWVATNAFGMNVAEMTYTTVHMYGGTYNDRGAYLDNVTVLPSNLSVVTGHSLDMNVTKVSVQNVGSSLAPVGSITMQMVMRIGTVIKKEEIRRVFQFRGDSRDVVVVTE